MVNTRALVWASHGRFEATLPVSNCPDEPGWRANLRRMRAGSFRICSAFTTGFDTLCA